jgi:putative salt-induced outer membrane protein YdiY
VKLGGAFVYQENEGDKTAERYAGLLRVDRDIDAWTYAFGQVMYDKDEPAGLDYRWTPTAGVGRVLWRSPDQELKAEVGGGLAIEKRLGLPETSDPVGYVGVHYGKSWEDKRKFSADLDFTPNVGDFDLSLTRLALAYAWPLCKGVSVVAGARFDYVISPPDDRDELDTLLTLGVAFEM